MSWSITGVGTKAALKKQIIGYFDPVISQTDKVALCALVDSAPDGALFHIESFASASARARPQPPWLEVKISLKLIAPTFEE